MSNGNHMKESQGNKHNIYGSRSERDTKLAEGKQQYLSKKKVFESTQSRHGET